MLQICDIIMFVLPPRYRIIFAPSPKTCMVEHGIFFLCRALNKGLNIFLNVFWAPPYTGFLVGHN